MNIRFISWDEIKEKPAGSMRIMAPMSGWWLLDESNEPRIGPFLNEKAAEEYVKGAPG